MVFREFVHRNPVSKSVRVSTRPAAAPNSGVLLMQSLIIMHTLTEPMFLYAQFRFWLGLPNKKLQSNSAMTGGTEATAIDTHIKTYAYLN